MNRRQGRDTQVHTATGGLHAEPPILREALFRNVHARKDLDTRHHRHVHVRRGLGFLPQNSVDAKAHTQKIQVRLDVEIGCLLFNGLGQEDLNQTHNGCFLTGGCHGGSLRRCRDVANDLFNVVGDVVELSNGGFNVLRCGDDPVDHQAGLEAHFIEGHHVQRVGHRHDQPVMNAKERDQLVFPGDRERDDVDDFRIGDDPLDRHLGNPQPFTEGIDEIGWCDLPRRHQDFAKAAPRGFLLFHRGPQLICRDQAAR